MAVNGQAFWRQGATELNAVILYGFPQSTYVRTARMACEEKGVPYQLESIKLRSDAPRELHPFGEIPVLQNGNFVLYETPAIARYVDEAFDGPPQQPADPSDRARHPPERAAPSRIVDVAGRRRVLNYGMQLRT